MNKINYYTFKINLLLIFFIVIFSFIIISKRSLIKNDMNEVYKDVTEKIKLLKKELNSMDSINLEYSKIINKTLLTERIEFKHKLFNKVNQIYSKNKVININEVESSINGGRKWEKTNNKSNEINLGFHLDPNYILRAMMTLASIIDSQKEETIIRLHFAVVLNFSIENIFKIYSLRERIRNDVEYNFYNAEKVEEDFKGIHPKGPGVMANLILPHLLPDDIDRIIILDTGDLLVLRDLKELYNWDIGNYLYLGAPDPYIGNEALISRKPFDVYINSGHFLLNVKKIKEQNMYQKYLIYKNIYNNSDIADQHLINDLSQKQIGYLPVRFGLFSPFRNDKDSDNPEIKTEYEIFKMDEKKLKNKFPFLPKNANDFFRQSYNPVVIHQWNGKWGQGSGLSIFRRLAQCYMRLAGVYNELCEKHPLYCKK